MDSTDQKKQPLFTIITPSFNQGKYVKRTIQSVLSQGMAGTEYLVFDGGSKDETVSILKSFENSIQWVSEPDRGQAHAVNKGLKAAKGEIIGWLNSDDIYYPGALQAVKEIFENHPEINILYGMADHIDINDAIIEPYYNEEWNFDRLKDVCFICQPAVFFRKSIIERFGCLDETFNFCMDYDYWLRIGKLQPFYYLKEKIAGSRLHPETKTLGSRVEVHEEILRMFKRKVGKVPSQWVHNHAYTVAWESGLRRATPEENLKFIKKVISVSIWDSLRLRHYVPISELRKLFGHYRAARRQKRRKIS